MKFVPILDRAACTDVKLIKSDQHQVFGRFTGTALLDDGTPVRVKDFLGFAERWRTSGERANSFSQKTNKRLPHPCGSPFYAYHTGAILLFYRLSAMCRATYTPLALAWDRE